MTEKKKSHPLLAGLVGVLFSATVGFTSEAVVQTTITSMRVDALDLQWTYVVKLHDRYILSKEEHTKTETQLRYSHKGSEKYAKLIEKKR